MRRLVLILFLTTSILPVFAQDVVTNQILALVNQERQAIGIPPLLFNTQLLATAQNHSNDMATMTTLTHIGSDGSQFWERIQRTGYNLSTGAENVLQRNDSNPQSVFQQWNNSAPHRANMLNRDYLEVGIAYAQAADGNIYFTMVLANQPGIVAPPAQPIEASATPIPMIPTATNTLAPLSTATPTRTLMPTDVMLATVIAPLPTIQATAILPTRIVATTNIIATNTPLPTPPNPDIRLVYSPASFSLINVSGRSLNLSELNFESTSGTFAASQWNTEFLTQALNNFTVGDCLQIWGFGEANQAKPVDCRFRHVWVTVGSDAQFWRGVENFIVRMGIQPVGICSIAAEVCDVSISTPIPEPTIRLPEPVSATQMAADLRLIYNADSLSMVNVSGRVLNLRGIVFRSNSGLMPIERWDTEFLSQSLSGFTAGDCLQVWGLGTTDLYPKPLECETRHAWIAVGDDFDFWRDTDLFTVEQNGRRIALCDAANGVCKISLSADFGTSSSSTPSTSTNEVTTSIFADVRLIITETSVTLLNLSSASIDVSNLAFESDGGVFVASRWDTEFLSRPLNALPSGDCLQIWSVGGEFEIPPTECSGRHAWVAARPDEQFWLNVNSFRVRWNAQVLQTCETRIRNCDFDLP
ncbi:MAG: CAP domain-containing protein [Anaerolineae bacterium]|nr:CAP domain-containing protein [Anaerolineae bacterium]